MKLIKKNTYKMVFQNIMAAYLLTICIGIIADVPYRDFSRFSFNQSMKVF